MCVMYLKCSRAGLVGCGVVLFALSKCLPQSQLSSAAVTTTSAHWGVMYKGKSSSNAYSFCISAHSVLNGPTSSTYVD